MKNREKSNKELVELLTQLIALHPTERFHQILRNNGFIKEAGINPDTHQPEWVNEFYTESEDVLKRVKEAVGK